MKFTAEPNQLQRVQTASIIATGAKWSSPQNQISCSECQLQEELQRVQNEVLHRTKTVATSANWKYNCNGRKWSSPQNRISCNVCNLRVQLQRVQNEVLHCQIAPLVPKQAQINGVVTKAQNLQLRPSCRSSYKFHWAVNFRCLTKHGVPVRTKVTILNVTLEQSAEHKAEAVKVWHACKMKFSTEPNQLQRVPTARKFATGAKWSSPQNQNSCNECQLKV